MVRSSSAQHLLLHRAMAHTRYSTVLDLFGDDIVFGLTSPTTSADQSSEEAKVGLVMRGGVCHALL
jgi:hypothetical protein